ncbi:WRKY transcription factor 55 [Senna tora]|uniref:WRKY transcription factor 55 n=1 Tax=Senna tora TaxID=362788 RepID=A0A834T6K9_9FABA|nr:WRKY transcription factor 55 [Senna tora]
MACKTNQKDAESETMEESPSSLIYRACELARNLESNFPNLTKQPHMLSLSIDEIVKAFFAAKQRIMLSHHQTPTSSFFPLIQPLQQQPDQMAATTSSNSMQQWLNIASGSIAYAQPIVPHTAPFDAELGSKGSEAMKASSSSRQQRRRRGNDVEKKMVMVPVPQFGNADVPPEDGYTWRKYGQKEIYGSKSYYRCTHQKLYDCPAKKQVQRLDDNPNIFAVTYRGSHTCTMSSTAPSSIPPPQLVLDHIAFSPQMSSSSTSVSRWLSSAHLSLHGGAAPSTARYVSGSDYLVADMADAMFNSAVESGDEGHEDKNRERESPKHTSP